MNTFPLSVRTPDGFVLREEIESLVVPGLHGSYGILAKHAPMIGIVVPGILRARTDADTWLFVVGHGVLEVTWSGTDILVDSALPVGDSAAAEEKLENLLRSLAIPPRVGTVQFDRSV